MLAMVLDMLGPIGVKELPAMATCHMMPYVITHMSVDVDHRFNSQKFLAPTPPSTSSEGIWTLLAPTPVPPSQKVLVRLEA